VEIDEINLLWEGGIININNYIKAVFTV